MHVAMFATGLVDDALRNTVPSVNEPLASARQCRVSVLCNVMHNKREVANLL